MKHDCEYRYSRQFDRQVHRWIIAGARGALELCFRELNDGYFTGGIEQHWRSPPSHMVDRPPSHSFCAVIWQPCWHDGSSLCATELWLPRWENIRGAPGEHDQMFFLLRKQYEEWFQPKEEEEVGDEKQD